jgi:Fe-S cluster assembly protein SufA/iron-sulfur cluster assembly protein
MSVATFDPMQISVTAAARRHIVQQIAQSGRKYVRLGVKESGCNGYMYLLDYVDQPSDRDQAFQVADDLAVFVSASDLPLVQGTEVDLVTEGLNSSLQFKNPNATSHCGCGESFSIATSTSQ